MTCERRGHAQGSVTRTGARASNGERISAESAGVGADAGVAGPRRFCEACVARLEIVRRAKGLGIPREDIARLMDEAVGREGEVLAWLIEQRLGRGATAPRR